MSALVRCSVLWKHRRNPFLRIDRALNYKVVKCCPNTVETAQRWSSATSTSSNPRGIGVVVTDFDDTCTDGDTIDMLTMASFKSAAEMAGRSCDKAAFLGDKITTLDELSRGYYADYCELLNKFTPFEVGGSKVAKTIPLYNNSALLNVLSAASDVERYWIGKVEESAILKGATKESIIEAGRKVALRKDCKEVLERIRCLGWNVHVLSVSWSAEYLRASLGPNATVSGRNRSSGSTGSILVHANELEYEGGVSTGKITGSLTTAADKLHAFEEVLDTQTDMGASKGLSVYIGDSPTDLLGLLRADIGIIFGNKGSINRFLESLNIDVLPLSEIPEEPIARKSNPVLYRASSWKEVAKFLLGSDDFLNEPQMQTNKVPRVLIVAGSDSGGGAGIQADLKACMMTGSFGTTAISALTSQNTQGVVAVHETPMKHFKSQMDAVLFDIGTDAVKTGMLPSAEYVKATAEKIQQYHLQNVVVDPVMVSTSGDSLAGSDVVAAFKDFLIPLATVLTPNIPEAEALLGGRKISTMEDLLLAAQDLHKLGSRYVLLKGGHFAHDPNRIVDVFSDGSNLLRLWHQTVETGNTHGTGCTLASAIASNLAQRQPALSAIVNAQDYIHQALFCSSRMKIGNGTQRPFNHGFKVVDWSLSSASEYDNKNIDLSVYSVTDPKLNVAMGRSLAGSVQETIEGGATIVQIREKNTNVRDLIRLVKDCMVIGRKAGVPIIVNDRVDVALASGADGVHVGQEDACASDVRRVIGWNKILGVSVSNVHEAVVAERDGADYVGAGAVFESGTKPESSSIGLDVLRDICNAVSIPVVAIGGITTKNAAYTIEAGCKGVAVVSGIFGDLNIITNTQDFKRAVQNAD